MHPNEINYKTQAYPNRGQEWHEQRRVESQQLSATQDIISPTTNFQSVVAHDGIAVLRDRDAPGQECIYIPPGDHQQEYYRIATFAHYPDDVPVLPVALAKVGFYFTGFKDRVKCFSCGMAVENWIVGDDVTLARWHRTDCLMVNNDGGDPRNVPTNSDYLALIRCFESTMHTNENVSVANPAQRGGSQIGEVVSGLREVNISDNRRNLSSQRRFTFANIQDPDHEQFLRSLDLKCEKDRRKTYDRWPSYPAPYLPRALAENGLFYLGNLDRTQCYFCAGVLRNWAPGDSVSEQHSRHFPRCSMFGENNASGNVPMTDQERQVANENDETRLRRQGVLRDQDAIVEPPDPSPEERQRLSQLYPLDNAVNPHMASLNERIQSFRSGWPGLTRATVEQIAKAGFFYLGESDKTKCYYCNGGLQNWDRNDEPWIEHAKWFPGCAFVIRTKGQGFVRTQYDLHPNLNRPLIRNPVSYDINNDIPPPAAPVSSGSLVEAAVNMGFPMERIQRIMRRKMDQDGRSYATIPELLDALLQEDNNSQEMNTSSTNEAEEHHEASPTSNPRNVQGTSGGTKRNVEQPGTSSTDVKKTRTESPPEPIDSNAAKEMQKSLRVMQESSICKQCRQNVIDVVCIPCGHLVLCTQCAPKVKRCVLCNSRIQETMKIFRA